MINARWDRRLIERNAPQSSTPWPMSATGRAAAPATTGSARTCSTFAAPRSSTTSMSSPATETINKQPDYLTGALGEDVGGGDTEYVVG